MAILRKACQNCTTSKRKCVVQLPKCTRCAQRGLECTYDLEPLKVPIVQTRKLPNMAFNNSLVCDGAGYCVIRSVNLHPPNIDPAICGTGNEDNLELMRLGYQSVPELLLSGRPALFVHPKLQLHGECNYLAAVMKARPDNLNYELFEHLAQLDVKQIPIIESLTGLQALLVFGSFLFPIQRLDPQAFLPIIYEWAQALLASAQTRMPPAQSSWQAWLFGESVRRTIIMAYGLGMALSSFKYGYCMHWLFMESLPFDERVGLWMATSPQAWIAAAGAKNGEDVGEKLISLHEFGKRAAGAGRDFREDTFLALLSYAHNG
ncbi:hypothetical protein BJY01DRAFT_212740 [Aspergillus pseudoustus]|uniref:Zn(2)-C6 fungal-type domain-containing protein n=1 Tax=Aspergillus pseudoustus TaxID=1810923 RepID=A0ABR4K4I6_9EURO